MLMPRLSLLVLPILLCGQDTSFNVQTQLVIVPTTVTDTKERSIDDLDVASFVVLDNGRKRQITVDTLATGVAPIALVVAVQSSGISAAALDKVRKIGSMIQPLVTGERGCAALLAFNERLQWLQECTNDEDLITKAFWRIKPGEPKQARMLDAVDSAVTKLAERPNARRVLLLVSESRDRGSETQLQPALMEAQAAGVAVYAITYSALKTAFTTKQTPIVDTPREDPGRPKAARTEPLTPRGRVPIPTVDSRADILGGLGELVRLGKENTAEALAAGTGGATYSFARQAGLETAIVKFGAELHSQYVISFMPSPAEPGYHQLEVSLPTRPGLRIRARPGYWTAPNANAPPSANLPRQR
jgi:VWFA-related protein